MQAVPTTATANDSEFERLMANPPTLSDVLASPLLHELYHWYLVSRFAPENLLFRRAVMEYQKSLASGDVGKARTDCDAIIASFLDAESVFEIPARKSLRAAAAAELTPSLFDDALTTIDRDLARGLVAFFQTDVFRSVVRYRPILEALNPSLAQLAAPESRARSNSVAAAKAPSAMRDATLQRVRLAYGVEGRITLRRVFDVASPFSYSVAPSGEGAAQIGWARESGPEFVFFDMQERELVRVDAAVMLGRSVASALKPKLPSSVEDHASSGCCGNSTKSRNSGVQAVDESKWLLKATPSSEPKGPVPLDDVRLWWKFHLLPEATYVCPLGGPDFTKIVETINHFPATIQVHMVDPTSLGDTEL